MSDIPPPDPPSEHPLLATFRKLFPELGARSIVEATTECASAWCVPASPDGEPVSARLVYVLAPFQTDALRDRFVAVVERLHKIETPGIVPLIDAGEREGYPYLTYACPAGTTLRQLFDPNTKKIEGEKAIEIAKKIIRSVAFLHAAGLHHGSIHPDNVIIDSKGDPWLISSALEMLFEHPPEIRTRRYAGVPSSQRTHLAPEQTDPSAGAPNYKSDIYALGSVLYSMLTGGQIGGFFKLPSKEADLDHEIDDIVTRCLQPKPEDRNFDAPSLFAALDKVETGYVVHEVEQKELEEQIEEAPLTSVYSSQDLETKTFWQKHGTKIIAPAAAAALLALGWLGYNHYMRVPVPIEPILAEAQTHISHQEPLIATEKINQAFAAARTDPQKLKTIVTFLVKNGMPNEAEDLMKRHLGKMDPDNKDVIAALVYQESYQVDLGAYKDASLQASAALDAGDDEAERLALNTARSTLPGEPDVERRLATNPIEIESRLLKSYSALQKQLPPGETLLHNSSVARNAVYLDLSSNHSLTSIEPLRGIRINELDISDTAISDLAPLEAMLLRRLWLDGSRVSSLRPISRSLLESLSFENTPITDLTPAADLQHLQYLRHTSSEDGSRVAQITPPTDNDFWENALGMRFQRLVEYPDVLFSTTELKVGEFAQFVAETGHEVAPALVVSTDDEEATSNETIAWDDDLIAPGDRYSAAGLSADDASAFCSWLTARDRAAGDIPPTALYRIPTDAEWGSAARLSEHPFQQPSARTIEGRPALFEKDPPVRIPASHTAGIGRYAGLIAGVREWSGSPYEDGFPALSVRGGASEISLLPPPLSPEPVAEPSFLPDPPTEADSTEELTMPTVPSTGLLAPRVPIHEATPEGKIDLRDRVALAPDVHRSDIGVRVVLALSPDRGLDPIVQTLESGEEITEAVERARALINLSQTASPGAHINPQILDSAKSLVVYADLREAYKKDRRAPSTLRRVFEYYKGRRYLHVKVPVPFDTADRLARAVGGHLVTLTDDGELDWVSEIVLPRGTLPPYSIWLGATIDTSVTPVYSWGGGIGANLPQFVPFTPDHRLLLAPFLAPTPDSLSSPDTDAAPGEAPLPIPNLLRRFSAGNPPVYLDWMERPRTERHGFLIEWG